ncbi:Protein kinase-like (PK-like) [Penicillium herquei]|nr:Protein kinase-like (PK-like) [Penicillium herquei]
MVWFILKWVLSILIWPFAILARPFAKKPKTHPPIPIETFKLYPYDTIDDAIIIEEESSPNFQAGLYYPVTIGEIIGARYQVHGKLNWSPTSTTWFGQDLFTGQPVSLKVYSQIRNCLP